MFYFLSKLIRFAKSFKRFSDRNISPPGQRAERWERIASESLQKIRRKILWGCRTCVGWVELKL